LSTPDITPETSSAGVVPISPAAATPATATPPSGFYDDGQGRMRFYDGKQWTEHYQSAPAPAQQVNPTGPMTSAGMNVNREVIYNRPQKGHSIILHLLFGGLLLWIPTIYYAVSPNHYYHA
jgi:hypothetical protein